MSERKYTKSYRSQSNFKWKVQKPRLRSFSFSMIDCWRMAFAGSLWCERNYMWLKRNSNFSPIDKLKMWTLCSRWIGIEKVSKLCEWVQDAFTFTWDHYQIWSHIPHAMRLRPLFDLYFLLFWCSYFRIYNPFNCISASTCIMFLLLEIKIDEQMEDSASFCLFVCSDFIPNRVKKKKKKTNAAHSSKRHNNIQFVSKHCTHSHFTLQCSIRSKHLQKLLYNYVLRVYQHSCFSVRARIFCKYIYVVQLRTAAAVNMLPMCVTIWCERRTLFPNTQTPIQRCKSNEMSES